MFFIDNLIFIYYFHRRVDIFWQPKSIQNYFQILPFPQCWLALCCPLPCVPGRARKAELYSFLVSNNVNLFHHIHNDDRRYTCISHIILCCWAHPGKISVQLMVVWSHAASSVIFTATDKQDRKGNCTLTELLQRHRNSCVMYVFKNQFLSVQLAAWIC